ncbi:MAG: hypothetical protein ABEJ69_02670 [Candidatus Nanohaloarchaea archaeon]
MAEEASLLTYNTKKRNFDSVYERNKFYRGLFGYKQTVKRNGKRYEYEKNGIMDEIPNIRIDNSVFIVSRRHVDTIEEYFQKWENKVTHHLFQVIIEDQNIIDRMHWKKC